MTERSFPLAVAGALSGFLIWAAHLLIVYVVEALACARGFADLRLLGLGVVPLTTAVATAAAVLAVGAILLATARPGGGGPDRFSAAPFLRRLTAIVAGLSLVGILWDALPVLMVAPCT